MPKSLKQAEDSSGLQYMSNCVMWVCVCVCVYVCVCVRACVWESLRSVTGWPFICISFLHHLFICSRDVCVCLRARARARVCLRVCVCVCASDLFCIHVGRYKRITDNNNNNRDSWAWSSCIHAPAGVVMIGHNLTRPLTVDLSTLKGLQLALSASTAMDIILAAGIAYQHWSLTNDIISHSHTANSSTDNNTITSSNYTNWSPTITHR